MSAPYYVNRPILPPRLSYWLTRHWHRPPMAKYFPSKYCRRAPLYHCFPKQKLAHLMSLPCCENNPLRFPQLFLLPKHPAYQLIPEQMHLSDYYYQVGRFD